MIGRLSDFLACKILAGENLTNDERELYNYGFFMLTSHSLYFVLACLFGIIFKCLLQAIIFYITFQLIRRFAGGYHADTEARCNFLSTVSIVGSVGIIKLSKVYDFHLALLCLALLFAVVITVFAPLDTAEKPLTKKEFCCFRKVTLLLLLLLLIIITAAYYFKIYSLTAPCCISLILEGILAVAGKIKRTYQKKQLSQK